MVQSFPATFKIQEIALDGVTIHTRIGGAGPAMLAIGADKSFGAAQADVLCFVTQYVTSQVIANSAIG